MRELPPGWTEAPLEVLVDILDSARVPLNATEREKRVEGKPSDALFPYYGATGQVGEIDDFLFDEPLILLGEDGVPFFDRLRHKAYLVQGKCWVNNHAHVLRVINTVADRRYLAGYLNIFDYNGFVTGSTRLKLTQAAMRSIPVSVAPLPEQKRIADKLDALLARADACRERLDRVPGILRRFRRSVLAAATSGELTREWREEQALSQARRTIAFEDDALDVPASWDEAPLADLLDPRRPLCYGVVQPGDAPPQGPLLVRVQDLNDGRIARDELRTISEAVDREYQRSRVRAGDVLISVVGTIGRLAIVPAGFEGNIARAIARLACGPRVLPEWTRYWLESSVVQWWLVRSSREVARKTLNLSELATTRVAVPSIPEQTEIVRRTGQLLANANQLELRLASAQRLLRSTTPSALAKAFRGELVPQDPNDEPASKLLARLRTLPASAGSTGKPKRGGTRGARTKAKADTNMLTRKDVPPTHLTTILKERGALTAEALWTASQLEIDDFYDQLKDEEARGLLRENRGDAPNASRLLEPAA